jgi:hypothetical protein
MEEMRQEPRVQFHKVEVPQQESALWFILASIFFFLFIIASVISGYYYAKMVRTDALLLVAQYRCEDLAEETVNLEVADQLDGVAPHFFVVRDRNNQSTLVMLDAVKGKEIEIYKNRSDGTDNFSLYAVPQVGYDGRVFIQRISSSGDFSGDVEELDILTGKVKPADFEDYIPSARTASSLSPSEGLIIYLHDNPVAEEWEKQAVMVDLVSGNAILVGSLQQDEYYSRYQGDSVQGGAAGFDLQWVSAECVSVAVFQDTKGNAESVVKELKEYREYCL